MRKPNKIERMNAYLYAWAILTGRIENPTNQSTNCVCPMLREYYQSTTGDYTYNNKIDYLYPEFAAQKPKKVKCFLDRWFTGKNKKSRIAALKNAIKLLA